MKYHAFLIEAHAYPELLGKIIERLKSDNHYFFIHIDKKTKDVTPFLALESDHVFFMHQRYNVRWGAFEQIELTIALLQSAQSLGKGFDYFHLISGQDYPVESAMKFDQFFENTDKSFMELVPEEDFSWRYMYYHINSLMTIHGCLGGYFDKCLVSVQKLLSHTRGIRKPLQFESYKGCNWWSLEKKAVVYMMDYLKKNPDYIKRFRYTYCCDEVFFHTIIFNSPFKDKIVLNDLRYVDWKIRDVNDRPPRVLDERDYESIMQSGCKFIRKVSMEKSRGLIDMIEMDS